ncbi:hypothetical protein CLOBOL_05612 [Enterocloster bolteae ATCC BAA-613]|uniref:Uncharacterized protein n=1 Tax=Enterocloster bolteae (strain ATCC BAA-613 / DSM 15670 / CCUG 46953 / JCM 12243 / WAL 16351) TaxID=411902 RepID=A8S085_ENTBW|nr:hypothetical protein CLOBOL_05612 [Enterocloster bolteae ATCC BAA-613]
MILWILPYVVGKDRTEKSGVFPFLLPEIPERVRIERWKNEKKGGMKK